MKFLDPRTLGKLQGLQLRVKYVVEGALAGLHSSSLKGHSLEFAQHREYAYGDELRHIDWKVFGRSDRLFIKQFQDETNLRAHLVLDASGSMSFSSPGRMTKLVYGTQITASLAYLLLHQGDAVGLGVFDEKLRFSLPPYHRLAHLATIFEKLEQVQAGGETGMESVLKYLGQHIKRRSLIVLVSDLLGDQAAIIKALKYFRFRHHEVIVLQVLDPDEIAFPYGGENTFLHLENNDRLYADCDEVADEYRTIVDAFISGYRHGFRQAGIDYHLLTTDMPLETALGKYLEKRN
jgi:uncharacterized protein (DUF58 family)